MSVDPALVKTGVRDEHGNIDEKTCRDACSGATGEFRHCRFITKQVEHPGSPPLVGCYLWPEDGGQAYLVKRVPITEELYANFDVQRFGSFGNCYEVCDVKLGQRHRCLLQPGRETTYTTEPFAVCRMYHSPGGGQITFGHGRAPAGLVPPRRRAAVGGFFARAAYLERASIKAFRVLAAELRSLGAPARFVRRARVAVNDERRHARVMTKLAHRHGASVDRVRSSPARPRTLFEIAHENAVEGCVNETFGALVAMHQARTADDPGTRRAMKRIADDEFRHAVLAWDLHAWCEASLTPREQDAIRSGMRRAMFALTAGAIAEADVRGSLGLPDRATATRWLEELAKIVDSQPNCTCAS